MSDSLSNATTTVRITGMTCDHCVSAVTEELKTLDSVDAVAVELNNGGISIAAITSRSALSATEIDRAIAEAGYAVVGIEA